MRLLIVTGSFPPMKCGVGDYSFKLATALSFEENICVGIVTSKTRGLSQQSDRMDVIPVMESWRISEVMSFARAVKNWSPDIVHIQYPTQGYGNGWLPWFLPLIALLMRKKVVQTWHEGYVRRVVFKLFLISIVPSALIFVRPRYQENLHSHLRWALWGKKIQYIPNASAIPKADLDEHVAHSLRSKYLNNQKRLIVFFGFVYPSKGVEHIFEIADPNVDQIVIAGEIDQSSEYCQEILNLASRGDWLGKVTLTGYLPSGEVAALLAVSDAVILPFKLGGGEWNTSIHGAVLNGAFVLTTSVEKRGYDEGRNVYYSKIDDVHEMKMALAKYVTMRRKYSGEIDRDEWRGIAEQHRKLYESLLQP